MEAGQRLRREATHVLRHRARVHHHRIAGGDEGSEHLVSLRPLFGREEMGQVTVLVVGHIADEGAGRPRLRRTHRQIDRIEPELSRGLRQAVVQAGGVTDFQ